MAPQPARAVPAPRPLRDWPERFDIAIDLAEEIGTPRWYRGFALLLALIAMALACWPRLAPPPRTPARLDGMAREELRFRELLPLAQGSPAGRRLAAGSLVTPLTAVPERPRIDLATTLGEGESLATMLTRAGAAPADAARAAALVAGAVPPGQIAPGTRFAVVLGPRPAGAAARPLESVDFRARFDLALGLVRSGGGLALTRKAIPVDATPLRIRGVAGDSLYRSARAAGAPPRAVQQFLQALDAHFSLDGVAPGDQFDLILSYKRAASGEIEEGQLLYAGLEHDGRPRAQLLRWGGEGQFFDAASMAGASQTSGLIMPVAGHLTSSFGMRFHPILGYSRMHSGTDFGAAYGSPIVAVADGLVSYAGVHGGHGNYVRLEHGGGVGSGYGHMSRIAVAPGSRVRAGQVIGYVGSTGLSTGPHLHYEVFRDGRPVDPGSVHFVVRAGVEPGQMARFKARLAQLLAVRPGAALAPLGQRLASAMGSARGVALR
ncbi:MAG: M23 family metallopeptidase [Proteobacteria bacterium]|nr:M23 family metallopeptidase [Pseudomonadota bacterium]